LKILVIHTQYQFYGGEDSVVEQEIELLKRKYTVESIFFKNKPGFKGFIEFSTSIWNLKSAKLVRQKIKTFKPDVVHLHNWHFASGPLIIRSINKLGIPIIHTLHNYRLLCPSGTLLNNQELFLTSLQQNFPFNAILNKVYRNSILQTFWLAFIVWFHKKLGTWKKIDKFVCLTKHSEDVFNKSKFNNHIKDIVIKPNFTAEVNIMLVNKQDHFLFIGRLSKEKGIENLLSAFIKNKEHLKIAGDGPLKNKIIQYSNKHENIEFLGPLKRNEVNQELQQASALIFPSIWYETFGMTIIEAFSSKCAVITSNIGAPTTIVENKKNGLHFDFGSVSSLNLAVSKWNAFSEEKKNEIRVNGFNSFKLRYTSDKQFDYFSKIYNIK
jgi:glycosyltransferase involved in cell wall biosynthesis